MKKQLLILIGWICILLGGLNSFLIYWNRQNTEDIAVQQQLEQNQRIMTNSLKIAFERINNYRITQTASEELETAFIEGDKEAVFDELITVINQAENVAGFNLETLRVYKIREGTLQHFLSIHDPNESLHPTPKHEQAFRIKFLPVTGISEQSKYQLTLLHYYSIFDFEKGDVRAEGVIELGVSIHLFLETIKSNFENTEVGYFLNKSLYNSTAPQLFEVLSSSLVNLDAQQRISSSAFIKKAIPTSNDSSPVTRQTYRLDFLPLLSLDEKPIGHIVLANNQTTYQDALDFGLWTIIAVSFGVTLVAIFSGFIVSHRIIAPIKLLVRAMNRYSEGDRTSYQLPMPDNEIKEISEAFGHLRDENLTLVNNLEDKLAQINEANQEILHINNVAQVVNSTLNLGDVIREVKTALLQIFEFQQIGILLVNEDKQELYVSHYYGEDLSETENQELQSLTCSLNKEESRIIQILKTDDPLCIAEVTAKELNHWHGFDRELLAASASKAALLLPLKVQQEIIGLIYFGNSKPYDFQDISMDKIRRYVTQVATAINNALVYQDLKETKSQLVETEKVASLTKILEVQKQKLESTNQSLADANVNMAELYIELEETNNALESQKQKLESTNQSLADANVNMAELYVELEQAKEVFQKFVPVNFLNRIAKDGIENIRLGSAESDTITILFSDIRSFTNLSENMSPQELLNFLNSYLKRMNTPIHKYKGFIDKFIGDAIMALFDRPEVSDSEEAHGAVHAAIDMQKALNLYNQHRMKSGYIPVHTGIGIHSGPVVIGTIGSETRMDSTVLGDAVNLAARLEELTKIYQCKIIASDTTHDLICDESIHWRELGCVVVKGKTQPVTIYEVFNGDNEKIQESKLKIMEPFHQGLVHYYGQRWEQAAESFEVCLEGFAGDNISQMYLKRCQQYQANPPKVDWNGVLNLGNIFKSEISHHDPV